jgi:hypothetical protein
MTIIGQSYPVQCAAPYQGQPLGYQQLTSFSAATNLTVPAGATYALINVEGTAGTDTVRWRDDGTAPTTSVGMLMNATGDQRWPPLLYAGNLSTIQFIVAAGNPKVNVSYYR